MIAVDTNVLIHAHRVEMPLHAACAAALRRLAEGAAAWAVPVFVFAEFVRVTTHPRVFHPPTTLDQAFAFTEALTRSPRCRVLMPGSEFLRILDRLAREGNMRGNRIYDAQIAAVCIEHGVREIVSLDRDMARMTEIRTIPPGRR